MCTSRRVFLHRVSRCEHRELTEKRLVAAEPDVGLNPRLEHAQLALFQTRHLHTHNGPVKTSTKAVPRPVPRPFRNTWVAVLMSEESKAR